MEKTYTKSEMYEKVDKDFLVNAIKKANLLLFKDAEGVYINDRNFLFGATDYKEHQNSIKHAKEMLDYHVNKLSIYDQMQRLNYYKDRSPNGDVFDTILFRGHRGGYHFYIGWKDGGSIKGHSSDEIINLMAVSF